MTRPAETGGCLCGAVRFRVDEPPANSFVCHCLTCRRASGGMHVAWVTVPAANCHLTGNPASHASSPGVVRSFCNGCGTSLTWQAEGSSVIDITLASFDEVGHFPPSDEIWTIHRPSWDRADERLGQWPEDYPDPA